MNAAQWAFAIFDVGSFGFYTATYNTFVPMYFKTITAEQNVPPHLSTAYWGYMAAGAMLASSVLAPISGWIVDSCGIRKMALAFFVLSTCILLNIATFIPDWQPAAIMIGLAQSSYALHVPLYNAFLPVVADPNFEDVGGNDTESGKTKESAGEEEEEMTHHVSITATWVGNLGAGVILVLCNIDQQRLHDEGSEHTEMTTSSMVLYFQLATIWWVIFAVPLWAYVRDTPKETNKPAVILPSAQDDPNAAKSASYNSISTGKQTNERAESASESTTAPRGGGKDGGCACRCELFSRRYCALLTYLASAFLLNEGSSILYQMQAIFAMTAAHIPKSTILQVQCTVHYTLTMCTIPLTMCTIHSLCTHYTLTVHSL
jgi:MFS-type transporter involved in bile tolerance (Atg22 family)